MKTSILGIDIGNTAIKVSWLDPLKEVVRIETSLVLSNPSVFQSVLNEYNIKNMGGSIISSVVPAITHTVLAALQQRSATKPLEVSTDSIPGLSLDCLECDKLGSDRIANLVGAKHVYSVPAIVVSVGTATTFDVIDKNGKYLGGAIAPGLMVSADALLEKAALLNSFPIKNPSHALGNTTEDQLLSGIIYGHIGLIKELIERLTVEAGMPLFPILTGGNMNFIAPHTKMFRVTDSHLLMKGLLEIYHLHAQMKT